MKAICRWILLVLSAVILAILGLKSLPVDNMIGEIMDENPNYKLILIGVLSFFYCIMYAVVVSFMSFLGCFFSKLSFKEKENFDRKEAQKYNKTTMTLLIALHVLCFGGQMILGFWFYVIAYISVGIVLINIVVRKYRKQCSATINTLMACIPYYAYVVINIIYFYIGLS